MRGRDIIWLRLQHCLHDIWVPKELELPDDSFITREEIADYLHPHVVTIWMRERKSRRTKFITLEAGGSLVHSSGTLGHRERRSGMAELDRPLGL